MSTPLDIRKTGLGAMDRVSRNFARWEYLCPCCGQGHPDEQLVVACQHFRDIVSAPVTIDSACRCPSHNAEVGGSPDSQHLAGRAADILLLPGYTFFDMHEAALEVPAFKRGGIGVYTARGFFHLDVRGKHARWGFGPYAEKGA